MATANDNAEQIELIWDLIKESGTRPLSGERSFPVAGYGLGMEDWRVLARATGSGVLDFGGNPYRVSFNDDRTKITVHPSLRDGIATAIVSGFVHMIDGPVSIPFEWPEGVTDGIVTLTYDHRRERDKRGPVKLEVHAEDNLPSGDGFVHIIITRFDKSGGYSYSREGEGLTRLAPAISAKTTRYLPPADTLPRGTTARISSGLDLGQVYIVAPSLGTGDDDDGPGRWVNTSTAEVSGGYRELDLAYGLSPANLNAPKYNIRNGSLYLRGALSHRDGHFPDEVVEITSSIALPELDGTKGLSPERMQPVAAVHPDYDIQAVPYIITEMSPNGSWRSLKVYAPGAEFVSIDGVAFDLTRPEVD